MQIHYLIHSNFEKLGAIHQWAHANQHELIGTNTYLGESLPCVDDIDALFIMGGPQSVCEIESYPYLMDEVTLIQACIAQKKIVVGICLGAQLIAKAYGANAEKSPFTEIGMFPIEITEDGRSHWLLEGLPQTMSVMHWHEDMLGLPPQATVLATSQGCPRQIVHFQDRVIGLQCHFELTTKTVQAFIDHSTTELTDNDFIQSPSVMLQNKFGEMNRWLFGILGKVIQAS